MDAVKLPDADQAKNDRNKKRPPTIDVTQRLFSRLMIRLSRLVKSNYLTERLCESSVTFANGQLQGVLSCLNRLRKLPSLSISGSQRMKNHRILPARKLIGFPRQFDCLGAVANLCFRIRC